MLIYGCECQKCTEIRKQEDPSHLVMSLFTQALEEGTTDG